MLVKRIRRNGRDIYRRTGIFDWIDRHSAEISLVFILGCMIVLAVMLAVEVMR